MKKLAVALAFAIGALSGLPPGVARAATGPYTLPFFNPSIGVSRGYTTSHRGIDYAMSFKPVAAARQGVVVQLHEAQADSGSCSSSAGNGNYVLLRHGDGQHTLYLHMKQNGVLVGVGSNISAGQHIGTSGKFRILVRRPPALRAVR